MTHPLITQLPPVRGQYRESVPLSDTTWFRVGGAAEVLFKPADVQDLADFLKRKPHGVAVTVLGVGSNLIVRDGGIDGVVIRLGRGFAEMSTSGCTLTVGAGCLDVNVAQFAAQKNLGGLEFLSGIPGTIGGALRMNAGAYGRELKEVLVSAEAISPDGEIHHLRGDEMGMRYRQCGVAEDWIFTQATLRATEDDGAEIVARMAEIAAAREASQPVRSRTGGSTFANPTGYKAWELIDAAGCRGMMMGAAQVSEKHCNFLINTGGATAADIEALGEAVREKVLANSGIRLEWEIKRIGKK